MNGVFLSNGVTLTKEEVKRLIKISRDDNTTSDIEDPMSALIDYNALSRKLGLHRTSFNLMGPSNAAV